MRKLDWNKVKVSGKHPTTEEALKDVQPFSLFEGIKRGLEQAIAYERGETSDVIIVKKSDDSTTHIHVGYCHSCLGRHSCCPYDCTLDKPCKHWKLGDCYTCKFFDVPDDEWFKRGCETWYPSGCKKYKRDWKKTFQFMRIKVQFGLKGW